MKFAHLSIGLLSLLTPLTAAWSKEDREIFRIRDEISAHEADPAATFYDILGLPPSASFDDINKAYRKKTVALHPDKVAQRLRAERVKKAAGKDKKTIKPPTSGEIKAAVKLASERQARLSLIANILKGPARDRYDHFLSNGFPLWKGTDYYYNRYRPGLGTVMVGLFIVGGGAIHYLILYMNWKRQREFVERYVKFARDTAWGGNLGIPVAEPQPAPATPSDEDAPPPVPQNRKERRMMEKETKKEGGRGRGRTKKPAKKTPSDSRDASSGPTGVRKRVVAENGKILVVDSLGDVYLEGEDEDGNVNEYLLDPNELLQPTFMDTAVVRLPMYIFNMTLGRFTGSKDAPEESQIAEAEEELEASQQTPNNESAGDDFELLDKSTDSLGKAKSSGMEKSGKSSKRKNKKR